MRTPSTIFTEADYLRAHITIIDMQPRRGNPNSSFVMLRLASRLEKWTFANFHLEESRASSKQRCRSCGPSANTR
jgi:hypothetical protein